MAEADFPGGRLLVAVALRVMTFNLRRDVPADGPHAWPHREEAAANLVARQAPDVLGTQEGLPHMLRALDARLPHMRRVGGCRRGDGTDESTAIYYDARRLLLVATSDVWLSDTPEVPGSASWGNRLPRMATWARFTDAQSGASFTVVNTHLDHESEAARVASARFLAQRFPDAILMGDFNAAPGEPVHAILTETHVDALGAEPSHTFHGFTADARVRLDWILVPSGMRVAACSVVRERPDGRYPSDHDPVVADLALTTGPIAAWPRSPG